MTTPQAEEYLQARLESCKLLGLDPDDLTPQEAIRADVVTVLRLSLDASQGQLLAGGNVDPAKVLALAETLSRAIPEREDDDPNYEWWNDPDDPRYQLKQRWDRAIEAARVDEREAAAEEIARLEALVAEQSAEIEDLRAACAKPVGAARPAALPAEWFSGAFRIDFSMSYDHSPVLRTKRLVTPKGAGRLPDRHAGLHHPSARRMP
jgi:hypothetical protein